MTTHNIAAVIDAAPMSPYQWRVLGWCFLIAIIDGFDTHAIAYTGPAIIEAFGLSASGLAPILAAGTLGMTVGAMVLGIIGDRLGRRQALLGAVLTFGLASLATAFVNDTDHILVLRFIAGLGMGGATPVVLSLTAEYAPHQRRGLLMTLVLLGLPCGAIFGGLISSQLLPLVGWQGIFLIGGVGPLLLSGVLYWVLPESLHFLALSAQGQGKIKHILAKMRPHEVLAERYSVTKAEVKASVRALLSPTLRRNTVAIWAVYFFNFVSWFLLLSWLPTVLKITGLATEQAPMGTVVLNTVFIVCALPLASLLAKVSVKKILLLLFGLGIVVSVGLAFSGSQWAWVFFFIGLSGMGLGGQQIVLNYMAARLYPTHLRASATGWAIGLGRLGSIVGAASGGVILDLGGPQWFYLSLIGPLLLAVWALAWIRLPDASSAAPMND
ncbi:MAG: MFS transporter [Neisseriaceae bacterium]|nr:MFS transporter [Neisseriaceae bacterium]